MPEELDLVLCKLALARFSIQMMLPYPTKYFPKELFMFFHCFGVDEYVVNEDDNPFIQQVMKDMIHHLHECGSGITQPKWHNQVLKGSKPSAHCGLMLIPFRHLYLVIPGTKIHFGKLGSTRYIIKQVIHMRQRISVLNGLLVKGLIVRAQPQASVFLRHKYCRRSIWTFTQLNESLVKQLLQRVLKDILLIQV